MIIQSLRRGGAFISMSVVEGLKIQIHVCETYVLSV